MCNHLLFIYFRVQVLFCTEIRTTVSTSILPTQNGQEVCFDHPAWQEQGQVRYLRLTLRTSLNSVSLYCFCMLNVCMDLLFTASKLMFLWPW